MRILRFLLLGFCMLLSLAATAQQDLLARNYMQQGAYEKAVILYESLLKETPNNPLYIYGAIEAYQQLEAYDKAESLLLQNLSLNQKNPVLEVELGYNYQLQGDLEKANRLYNKVIAAVSENVGYASRIGQAFQKHSLLDEAIKTYTTAETVDPRYNFGINLAPLYGEQGNLEEMFSTYINLIERDEKYQSLAQRYINDFIKDDAENEANQLLKKVLLTRMQENPDLLYNRMLSWLFIQQKEYGKSFIQEKAIAKRSGSFLGIEVLARVAVEEQENDLATSILEYLIKENPSDESKLYSHLQLLDLRIQTATAAQLPEIKETFETLLTQYGKTAATLGLQTKYAHFLAFNNKEKEQASVFLEESLKLPLNVFQEARVKMELADILVLEERFNAALIYYSQIQKKLKDDVLAQEARFKVAKTSYYKGDFDWAKTQLKVLKSSAEQLIANDSQDLYLLITDNTVNDSTQAAIKAYAQADLLTYQNREEEALEVYEALLVAYEGAAIEDEALLAQAKLLEKKKDFAKAEANYLKIIELHAEDILADDAHYRLANLYAEKLLQPEKAKVHYEYIIFNFADSIFYVDAQQKYRKLRGDAIN